MTSPTIVVLCGGVGAARFLRGLVDVVDAASITAIVNVADDTTLHGLHVSPDIDTVVYTLADAIDPDRGWGLRDESWRAMEALSRFGDGDWFSLGDRDLGTHLHRTGRLAEGASLAEVTAEITEAFGVGVRVLPVSNDRIETRVRLAETGVDIGFQEYFVGRQHDVAISEVAFVGATDAAPLDDVIAAIGDADVVVVAPSNPIVSIGPLRALPAVEQALEDRTGATVAISPLVGGEALKGPAARMLRELGHRADAVGVSDLYQPIVDTLVIDDLDSASALAVAAAGCTPYVTDTIMSNPERSARLARATLSAAGLHRRDE